MRLAHAPVVTEPGVEIGEEPGLALIPVDQRLAVQVFVVGRDHAAFAAGYHLRRIEAERGCRAERTGHLALARRAVRVRGIFEQPDTLFPTKIPNGRHFGADNPANVHHDDPGCRRRHAFLYRSETDTEGRRIGVDEPRAATRVHHRCRRRKESVRRHQHIAPGNIPQRNGISSELVPLFTATA